MAHVDVTAPLSPCVVELTAETARSGAVVVAVRGELEMTTCSSLGDRLSDHLRSTHQLVLDLGGVSLLCAAGLTVLVEAREMARATGTSLCVVAHTRLVLEPLMITGLTDVFDLHPSVADALLCEFTRFHGNGGEPEIVSA